MKYKKLTGIILKKQNYREADQIITFWSREAGKFRFLAKSVRLAKSKLSSQLLDLNLVEIEVAGRGSLPIVISATCQKSYKNLHQDLVKMGIAFYASELMMKMTADENPNEQAFNLIKDFLEKVDKEQVEKYILIDEFALSLAVCLGFGTPKKVESHFDVRSFMEDLMERNLKSETLLNQLI